MTLAAPRRPGTIIGVGLNYLPHAADLAARPTELPTLFFKGAHTVISAGDPIPLPPLSKRVTAEAELGLVIGRRMYQVTAADAPGGGAEGPRFDLASFGSYLQRQAAAIRAKTGCAEVQFRLAAEDGKLRLKARPLPPVTPTTPVTPASPVRSKEKT